MGTPSTYIIAIKLKGEYARPGVYHSHYLQSTRQREKMKGDGDTFEYLKKSIILTCQRSALYDEENIFSKGNNSLLYQIRKALMFFILTNSENATVSQIVIKRTTKTKDHVVARITGNRGLFPIIPAKTTGVYFDVKAAKVILDEDECGCALRLIVNHWLSALPTEGEANNKCFLALWMAFEECAKFISREDRNLRELKPALAKYRKLLLNEFSHFEHAELLAKELTYEDIRILQWRDCINNLFARSGETGLDEYLDYFIGQNKDFRIVEVMRRTLPFVQGVWKRRKENVINEGEAHQIDEKLRKAQREIEKKDLEETNDRELLAVLVCRYAYFYRCKVSHGEWFSRQPIMPIWDEKAEKRLALLCKVLNSLIIDSITHFMEIGKV